MHSTGQHSTTWWSDHHAFHRPTQYHMVVRSSCSPPVNTVPHGGQITVHSTGQHSTTWWSDHHAVYQSTQYHKVVRSSCIPPVTTVPHSGQITAFHQSPQYQMVVTSRACEERQELSVKPSMPPQHTYHRSAQTLIPCSDSCFIPLTRLTPA